MQLFEVSRPTTFRDYLGCLAVLSEDINLNLDYEGLKVDVMDPSHVALVNFVLPNSYFDSYSVGDSERIGVNVKTVLDALGKITKADRLSVEYDYNIHETKDAGGNVIEMSQTRENEKLTLTLVSDIKRKKIIPCLEPLTEEIPTPKIFFKSKTRIILSTLKRIVDDFDGEHIAITSNQDGVTFSHEGDAYSESTPLDKDNDNIIEHKVDEPCKATYTKSYLKDILKAVVKVSEVATLEFSENMPIKMDIEIPQGTLVYYLAPCIM